MIDSISYLNDDAANLWDGFSPPISTISQGVQVCQGRTYTLGGDWTAAATWLQYDWTNGVITASTTEDTDINYAANGGRGYEVTLQGCLTLYPTQCSTTLTFYVKV